MTLPAWGEMSDTDRAAAVAFAWHCRHRGARHALEHAPCRYIDAQALQDLDVTAAGLHALLVCGPLEELIRRIGKPEYDRIYNLALPRPTC
ncbi:hypothetical protein ACFV9C_44005 [Kribbella sp. NPDC059898]|uniref:hypothetical protein n=1 Tax=Kribbella sp. NPDC059898 TaxID=3346995 RepID=UPI003658344C